MTTLLRADSLSAPETLRACDSALRAVAPVEARLARLLDGERRDDLAVVGGWFAIAAQLVPPRDAPFDERRVWDELRRELDAAFEGEARTPLGRALAGVASRRALAPEPFTEFLSAVADDERVAIHQTRDEVEASARRVVGPWTRALLPLFDADTEKGRILAEALGVGCLLARWWGRIGHDWRLDGRLRIPMEDLGSAGVDLASIDRRTVDRAFHSLLAAEGTWALEWLGKGWPLTAELGPWRGRLLAAALRRRLLSLVTVVRKGADLAGAAPRDPRWRVPFALALGLAVRRRPRWVGAATHSSR